MTVEYYTKVDVSTLHYKPVVKNKKGSNVVYLSRSATDDTNCKVQLNMQSDPRLTCPFGLNSYDDQAGGRMTLDISLEDPALLAWAESLDRHNVETAVLNKGTWFKPGVTDEEIRKMYYPVLALQCSFGAYPLPDVSYCTTG